MSTTTSEPRLDLLAHTAGPYAAMVRVEERIRLDPTIRHLVKLRASQINGCAFCLDMHWTDARADGETEVRLAQLPAWDESPYFDERERAALALTDAMTHVSTTHVPDDVWERAAARFSEEELSNLVFSIAAINLWNRLAIATRKAPASFGAA
ncbi:MAG: carboxymuconolactone decarboxylase family protein [Solirubrobacteraceae bacterium]